MAIINLDVTEGAEIKKTAEDTEKYIASRVIVEPMEGFAITKRDAISGVVGALLYKLLL